MAIRYRPLALDGVYERRPKRPAAFSLPVRSPPSGRPLALRGKTPEDIRLLELLDPVAEAAGYDIVRLRLMGGTQARRLQIMAERDDGTMLVEDCARLARAIGAVLDAADPISGDYTLEVSSPGIDRPLTRLKDFETYEGLEARLEIDRLAEGRKRFKGELAGVEDGHVAINLEGEAETALLPFAWLIDARLVINDALLKRGAAERAARMDASLSLDAVAADVESRREAAPDEVGGGPGPTEIGGALPPPRKSKPAKGPPKAARLIDSLEDQKD